MKRYILLTLGVLMFSNAHSQLAEKLNIESKELIAIEKFKEAIPLLKEAANLGSPESQYNLGVCYQYGSGIEKNDSIATHWYKKSADSGWKDGQYKMSYAHMNGNGIPKDESKAFEYTLLCATQGDIECISNLISTYKDGIGIKKDSSKVLEWAINLGKMKSPDHLKISGQLTSARLNLAHMYYEGNGAKKDLLNAYAWFLIYNESKRDFSVRVQEHQIQIIKELEAQLTPKQKDEAVNLSEEILERKLENLDKLHEWNK